MPVRVRSGSLSEIVSVSFILSPEYLASLHLSKTTCYLLVGIDFKLPPRVARAQINWGSPPFCDFGELNKRL